MSIINKSSKDNTYKFALMKFLLDYANQHKESTQISYITIAEKFLEYYWYQECKYKLKQDFKKKKLPTVIQIIREHCGTDYIPESYAKYFDKHSKKRETMTKEILSKSLHDVIPRLQSNGVFEFYQHFHTLSPSKKKFRLPPKDKRYIILTAEAHHFFKENYNELSKLLIFEWAKFLERTNFTPRLISKIEDLGLQKRNSLTKFRNILLEQTDAHCFYCNTPLATKKIHVDHFIPWSYLYEDAIWNLVLSCEACNLKKSDHLPPEKCLQKLEDRNEIYHYNEYDKDLKKYYINCSKAGFLNRKEILCS